MDESDALDTITEAVTAYDTSHLFALFSGGHDSLTSTAIAAKHPSFTAAVHINTGIGIEQTREFVRETCKREGWPLLEYRPDRKDYDQLVLERGFPHGPKSHNTMYYWLKQRQVRLLVSEFKRHWNDRIGLVTGVRRKESVRRFNSSISVPIRKERSQVWINPILDWTAVDCSRFIDAAGLTRNRVVDLVHRSGECLCGALMRPREREDIFAWFPEVRARIEELENRVREAGHKDCIWAGGTTVTRDQIQLFGMNELCSSCEAEA